jgi:hypothetical protein
MEIKCYFLIICKYFVKKNQSLISTQIENAQLAKSNIQNFLQIMNKIHFISIE